jgi:4-hydroxyphenylpyruvate dioxygenase
MNIENPANTNGFDFLEFTTKDFKTLDTQFRQMGFLPVAKHNKHEIILYQQNDIRFLVNIENNSLANQFATLHGASTSAMGFLVDDATKAYEHAVSKGGKPCPMEDSIYNIPAIYGVGNSLIYFVDYKNNNSANYLKDFTYLDQTIPSNGGLTYIDHVTHNLHRGNMDKWAHFYESLFNFKEIRYFDIEGQLTGLKSRAMTSPCGKIRIPLNESSDDKSQIEEFLKDFNGEGIQHIALGTDDIYCTIENLGKKGLQFLDTPDTYYELIEKRLPKHGEDVQRLKTNKILIDGNTEAKHELLLQIFTKNMLGPVFFEIIQRKGDQGFGEGNFRALFESIELDQIQRGVL